MENVRALNTENPAIDPADIEINLNGPMTPYNIASAMRVLAQELEALNGPDAVDEVIADIKRDNLDKVA